MNAPDEEAERRGLLPRFTLKDENMFLLCDALGDVHNSDDGMFVNDTRMLSKLQLLIAQRPPALLGAAISQDNTLFTAHLTNRPLAALGELSLPHGVLHIERSRFLHQGQLHERLKLTNYSDQDAVMPLKLIFFADFADIFEVQGHVRTARGELLEPQVNEQSVRLSYRGLDGVLRMTHLEFSIYPSSLSSSAAEFMIPVGRGEIAEMFISIGTPNETLPCARRFSRASRDLTRSMEARLGEGAVIKTSGRLFNQWISKSRSDLALLTTMLPSGPYPYAGIPWFATQFGRDAIITALQTLWMNPGLAAGVLEFLASTQAHEASAFRDSQPGKIMHEMRRGEMAVLGEVPFGCYYGGVDTTPLYVMLAGAYEMCTGDTALIDRIWPALIEAVHWIERRLDGSPTGFLDYARAECSGLVNQAWKDSHDSIFHADGRFPQGPVAVVEVQGYAYAALRTMASLALTRCGEAECAAWMNRAMRLRASIEERFWLPKMEYYALALDGNGEPCCVRASNPGHLLFCEVPQAQRAAAVSAQLCSARFSSGWGIRTLAEGEPRYNPMSYHNGSIWPHDTSVCAAGMARYGKRKVVVRLLAEIFEAANHFAMRLPELYCGLPRIPGQAPAPYPVACLPQAWASGAVFLFLQSILGIRIHGSRREVHIERPALPLDVEMVHIQGLQVGRGNIDLSFRRIDGEVVVAPFRHIENDVRVLAHL